MAVAVGGEADNVEAASVDGWIKVMFSSSESDVSMDITVAEIKAIVQLIKRSLSKSQKQNMKCKYNK